MKILEQKNNEQRPANTVYAIMLPIGRTTHTLTVEQITTTKL